MKPYSNSISETNTHQRRAGVIGWSVAAIAILLMVVVGCSRLDITGPEVTNQAPELILANVPAGGSLFSANPVVYWFGTDVDGRVARYDYAVLPESTVQRYIEQNGCPGGGLSDAERFIQCATDEEFQWTSIFVDSASDQSLPTQRTVNLFAAFDTLDCDSQLTQIVDVENDTVYYVSIPVNCISKSIPQYMFIRAIDDLGASSQIKYRSYLRNNHWPETEISRDFELTSLVEPYFSLPELTQTYRGILVTWEGSDRSDFLRDEPPLEYYWRVFGPYESPPTIADTLDPTGERLIPAQESQSSDPRKGVWVADTLAYMYNLWGNHDAINGSSDTSRTGWFGLVVSTRDDAFVSDPSPDFVAFRAIDPKFERDVLLCSQGAYHSTGIIANPTCRPYKTDAVHPDCCHEFWRRMGDIINEASPRGWEFEKDWAEINDQNPLPPRTGLEDVEDTTWCRLYGDPRGVSRPNCYPQGPTLDVLARHRLVIYSHEDMDVPVSYNRVDQTLAAYCDIGGMLWLVDRIPFMLGTENAGRARFLDFTSDPDFHGRWPTQYFDIEGLWYPAWRSGLVIQLTDIESNDEFVGAYQEGAFSNLPDSLFLDKERLDSSYLNVMRTALASQTPPKYVLGLPGVPFVLRGSNSRTLYRFNSWRPEMNNAQGAVVMSRFVGPDRVNPRFKTAWLGCPLYFLNEDDAADLIRGMLDWFLVQPLEVL